MAKTPVSDKCAITMEAPVGLEVMEEGKPFFFDGGDTGCLLIHGFTGTTSSMRLMGEYLAAKGITCLGPRLPGHGTSVEDMGRWSYTDWTSTAETALGELREICGKVYVTGLSMGGLLTLYLAERHSDMLAGAIPISAPAHWLSPGLNGVLIKGVGFLKHLIKQMPGPGNDVRDPDVTEVAYDKLSTSAAHELLKLQRVVDADMSRITCPIKIFAGRNDHVVPPKNSQYIYDNVSSKDKELLWLPECYHVATLDCDKEKIFEASYNFMTRD